MLTTDDLAPGTRELRVPDRTGRIREYLLFVPEREVAGLAVLFHPFGSRPELVLGGGVDDGYLIRPLSGVASSARMLGLAVLAPRALGRRLAGVSLAWEEHLDAVSELAAELRQRFGLPTLGAGGLSMGGLEALVFAGRHPRQVSAVWAANPIVDLAGWWEDLAAVDVGDGAGLSAQIEDEVGGAPIEASAAYRAPIAPFSRAR